ncbi:SKP1-like protein 11 [Durio zibethinus]|uniref:SKP1-like protein n=1 Tax=Durio zibethinus TaxID=66656 RepID=A0A6P6AHG0_DURZI|nr:SKP1-like protein 11 [Durio zibethinus]
MSTSKVLTLMSKDNQIFEVEESVAMQSELIKNMIEDGCATGVIPLFRVHSRTLTMIIEWCKNHVDYVEANNVADVEKEFNSWESEFLDVDRVSLNELFMAANYLNIEKLLKRVAKQVADMIKASKTVEEIRQTFGIKNDFTPQEEEEIRKQYSWIDD